MLKRHTSDCPILIYMIMLGYVCANPGAAYLEFVYQSVIIAVDQPGNEHSHDLDGLSVNFSLLGFSKHMNDGYVFSGALIELLPFATQLITRH